jgi:putative transposase
MARLPRIVLPGIPHHITQRGNRRERTFFEEGDYALYLDLLSEAARRNDVEIWSYCLMPNHIHVIAVPHDEDGLSRTFRHVHRHYTGYINARMRATGHLWQGRFSSVAMDEPHLFTALRYVALNPVRARLVGRAEDWPWSSVRAHLHRRDDQVVTVAPALERIDDFAAFLGTEFDEALPTPLCARPKPSAARSARPTGSRTWPNAPGSHCFPASAGPSRRVFRGLRTCHRNSRLAQGHGQTLREAIAPRQARAQAEGYLGVYAPVTVILLHIILHVFFTGVIHGALPQMYP